MLTGFARAAEMGADVLVKMDGDGQMDPRDLPLLVEPLLFGKADYAKEIGLGTHCYPPKYRS